MLLLMTWYGGVALHGVVYHWRDRIGQALTTMVQVCLVMDIA